MTARACLNCGPTWASSDGGDGGDGGRCRRSTCQMWQVTRWPCAPRPKLNSCCMFVCVGCHHRPWSCSHIPHTHINFSLLFFRMQKCPSKSIPPLQATVYECFFFFLHTNRKCHAFADIHCWWCLSQFSRPFQVLFKNTVFYLRSLP